MANTIRIPVPGVAYARVDFPEIDIDDNPYEAVESAAGGIAGALEEREASDDEEFVSRAIADLSEIAATDVSDSLRDGTAGPGYTTRLNDRLDARFKYWESQTDRPRRREALRWRYATMRPQMLDLGMRTEADLRAQGAFDTTTATMQLLAEVAHYRPDQIGALREEARLLREEFPEREATLARHEQLINEAYLRGLMRTNPKLALETLRSRKGAAAEDLGIPEPLREALEREAEFLTDAESASEAAAQDGARIALRLDIGVSLADFAFDPKVPIAAYEHVRDAYKVDPATAAQLETRIDNAYARAARRAKRHASIGRALVEGRAVTWDAHRLESLDTHIDAVANDGSDQATANNRRVRMAIIAGQTPPQMQGHILKSLRASDPRPAPPACACFKNWKSPTKRTILPAGPRPTCARSAAASRRSRAWATPTLRL